jgi:uncharacterized protein
LKFHLGQLSATFELVKFDWDSKKEETNLRKHGYRMEAGIPVFDDPNRLDRADKRRDYAEERRIIFGMVEKRLFAVVYTMRGDVTRLISVRRANAREERRYKIR